MQKKTLMAIFLLAIALATILIRIVILSHTQGFIDSEGDLFYSVAQQTLANNLNIPPQLHSVPQAYTESPLLIYFPIAIYLLLFKSVSLLGVMQYIIPTIFILLDILAVYILASKLTGKEEVGIISAFIFAVIPAGFYNYNLFEYIGSQFAPTFVAYAIIFQMSWEEVRDDLKLILAFVCAILSIMFWSGGFYALAIMLFSLLLDTIHNTLSLPKTLLSAILTGFVGFLFLIISPSTFLQTLTFNTYLNLTPFFLGLSLVAMVIGVISFTLVEQPELRQNAYLQLLALLIITLDLYLLQLRWLALAIIPICVFSGYGIYAVYTFLKSRFNPRVAVGFCFGAMLLFNAMSINADLQIQPSSLATNQTFQAMNWINNNTPSNSVFFAYCIDSGMIEAFANRSVSFDCFSTSEEQQRFTSFLNLSNTTSALGPDYPNYLYLRNYVSTELPADAVLKLEYLLYNCLDCSIGNVSLTRVYHNADGVILKLNYT